MASKYSSSNNLDRRGGGLGGQTSGSVFADVNKEKYIRAEKSHPCCWHGCPENFVTLMDVYFHVKSVHIYGPPPLATTDNICRVQMGLQTHPCDQQYRSRSHLLDHIASHFPISLKPFSCKVK